MVAAARRASSDYCHALRMLPAATPGWTTPVLPVSARTGTGIDELWRTVADHRALLESSGLLTERRAEQQRRWLRALLDETILSRFHSQAGIGERIAVAEAMIREGKLTVPLAVRDLTADAMRCRSATERDQ
jgi:LAO/AO transport system kinase